MPPSPPIGRTSFYWAAKPSCATAQFAGYLTSGGYGYTVGKPIGLGYVRHPDGVSDALLASGRYELVVANETRRREHRISSRSTIPKNSRGEGMKILVAVKRVVDANLRVRVKADGSGVELDNVKMSMNPFDEIAVEEAVRLKEAGIATEIVVVSIGPAKAEDTLRQALAMGADRAILVVHDAKAEPLGVAKTLAAIAKTETPDLLLLGKQAIDDDSNQTGQMLAALLGRGQATFASKLEIADGKSRPSPAKSMAASKPSSCSCPPSSPPTSASTRRASPRCPASSRRAPSR